MPYVVDFANMVVASLFLSFLFKRRPWAICLFLVYFVTLKWVVFGRESSTLSSLWIHYELFALLIYMVIIAFSRNLFIAFRHEIESSFTGLSLLYGDNRGILISKLWTSTVVATSTMGYLRYHGLPYPSEGFYVSWAVNVVFFTVIGLAAALVGLRLPHREEFSSRLSILFAGTENVDNEFRQAALSHVSSEVKKLGLAIAKVKREISVEAYDPNYDAYRATVVISTSMVSLFGDVDARDQVLFSVTPDTFKGCATPPNPVGQITSLFVNGEEKIKGQPHPILIGQGNGFPKFSQSETKNRPLHSATGAGSRRVRSHPTTRNGFAETLR